MPEFISKITLPNGTTYEIKDLGARQLIQDLSSAGISFIISSTAGDTPAGVNLVPVTNTEANNIYAEYICAKSGEATYIWEKLGTTEAKIGSLGALAYKSEASGSVTVLDTVSANFTNGSANVSGSYTPQDLPEVH